MLKKLQKELHERIDNVKDDLNEVFVEGTAGGGVVKVTANGNSEITKVSIAPDAIDPDDPEMLQDLIMAATNQALEKAKQTYEDSISDITGGLRFPGLF